MPTKFITSVLTDESRSRMALHKKCFITRDIRTGSGSDRVALTQEERDLTALRRSLSPSGTRSLPLPVLIPLRGPAYLPFVQSQAE